MPSKPQKTRQRGGKRKREPLCDLLRATRPRHWVIPFGFQVPGDTPAPLLARLKAIEDREFAVLNPRLSVPQLSRVIRALEDVRALLSAKRKAR